MNKIIPFEFQEESIRQGIKVLTNPKGDSQVIVSATASGKSIIIAEISRRLPKDGNILVVQPNIDLMKQNLSKIRYFGVEPSVYSASYGKKEIGRITYATPMSLKYEDFKGLNIKYLIVDECFTGDTPIFTKNSSETFESLYKKFKNGKKLPLVESYNECTGKFEYKKIVDVSCNGLKNTVDVKFTNGLKVSTTINHPFLTDTGWKMVAELKEGDIVLTSSNSYSRDSYFRMNSDQTNVFIGSSLGDGNLDNRSGNGLTRLRVVNGIKQEKYLRWKASIFNRKDKVSRVDNQGYSGTTVFNFISDTISIDENLKTYEEQIKRLNFKSLAILWMDDGHLSKHQNSGSLYSLCESEDLVIKLNKKINELGIDGSKVCKSKSSSTGKTLWYIKFSKNGVYKLSELCHSFIHRSMSYKVVDFYRNMVGSYIWDTSLELRGYKIKTIKDSSEKLVYNIEVKDNHNYIVTSKINHKNRNSDKFRRGGAIVHNCENMTKSDSKFAKFKQSLGIKNVLGLTASPVYLMQTREGSKLKMITRVRGKFFKDICHVTQVQEMIKLGRWSKLNYKLHEFDNKGLVLNSNGSDYTEDSLKINYVEANLESKILGVVKTIPKGEPTIIYISGTENVEILANKIGKRATFLHAKVSKKDREERIRKFLSGEIDIMVNNLILVAGFDYPNLRHLIDGSPTKSVRIHIQKYGRMVRVFEGKLFATVHDLVGNTESFGKIEDINFEYIQGYGWGMFSKDILLTDVPIGEKWSVTKQQLREHGSKAIYKSKTTAIYSYNNKIDFGKYNGKTIAEIYKIDKGYLKWLIDPKTNFNFGRREKLKEELLKIFKVG